MAWRSPRLLGLAKWQAYKPHGSGGILLEFHSDRIQIYCNYPDRPPRAAERTSNRPWRNNRGDGEFELGVALARVRRHQRRRALAAQAGTEYARHPQLDALERFMALFEPEYLQLLEPFPRDTWPFYVALRRCPGLFELASGGDQSQGLAGDAALAFALSLVWNLVVPAPTQPLRTVRALLKRRRRDIAARLGLVSSPNLSALNVLARVPSASVTRERLHQLRIVLHSDDPRRQRLLAHTGRVNGGVIDLLSRSTSLAHVTPALVEELGHARRFDGYGGEITELLRDTASMAEGRGVRPPLLRSLAQLQQVHDEELAHFTRRWMGRRRAARYSLNAPLPTAPVRELPGVIEYVSSSVAALDEEGQLMRNCVGNYAQRVAQGECYIYRVLAPERCTLAIAPGADGHYHLQEIRLARNADPGPATLRDVQRWLRTSEVLHHRLPAEPSWSTRAVIDWDAPAMDRVDIPF